ncbi:hypothetical protein GF343_04205 [Candidatus Woesearchaeota archaeon]|nr:hypothetical protein [Candidatus Woesearchaeota archaeon]
MKMLFIESFKKIDKKFVYVVLFDLLFYAGLALSVVLFSKLLIWAFGSFLQIPGKLLALSKMTEFSQLEAGFEGAGMLLDQFRSKLVISFAVLWVLVVAVFTFFKGSAWAFVSKTRLDKKYFIKLLKLNLWWFGVIGLLVLVIFWFTKPAATGFSVLLLAGLSICFTAVFYSVFDPKKSVRELFQKLWYVGVERIYYFILPFLLAKVILILYLGIIAFIAMLVVPDIALYVLFAFFVVWQAWFKYYIYLVARGIK